MSLQRIEGDMESLLLALGVTERSTSDPPATSRRGARSR